LVAKRSKQFGACEEDKHKQTNSSGVPKDRPSKFAKSMKCSVGATLSFWQICASCPIRTMYRMMSATLGQKVNIWSDKVMDSPRSRASRDYEIEPQVMDSPGFPIKSWRARNFIAGSLPTVGSPYFGDWDCRFTLLQSCIHLGFTRKPWTAKSRT
jgi:hypothetical protein